jgi:ABC-type dipeptide/oligopeptide/nickel transport system ATPase subunit
MVNVADEAQKLINAWVDKSKSLRIVIFGKTGAGKSSLINTLFEEQMAKEGNTLYAETKVVSSYTKMITLTVNDVHVTLWDTPGFKDPFSDGEETIKNIRDNCDIHDIDLFVYCIRFDQTRLGQDDVDCIRDITKAFGDKIWKRALFTLTFANQAKIPPSSKIQNIQEYFQSREREWREGLHQLLKMNVNVGEIPVGKIDSIPVVATGYRDLPLPDGRNWFAHFWEACLLQVKIATMPALIRATGDRVKGETERAITARIVGLRLQEIGDRIAQELSEAEFMDYSDEVPRVVATAQWSVFLIEAIQQATRGVTLEVQLTRSIGNTVAQYKTSGLLLVAGIAIVTVCVLYHAYRSNKK